LAKTFLFGPESQEHTSHAELDSGSQERTIVILNLFQDPRNILFVIPNLFQDLRQRYEIPDQVRDDRGASNIHSHPELVSASQATEEDPGSSPG